MCNLAMPSQPVEVSGGLEAHSLKVKKDLEILAWPGKPWTRTHSVPTALPGTAPGAHIYDALIVGGGQCGLAVAYGLMRERVTNVLCLDENKEGAEGPWVTYARMVTLRTPKHLTGLDFGLASLTFQAYYEARFGSDAWAALDKIPKEMWMAYLVWYRKVLNIPVRNGVRVERIEHVGSTPASDAGSAVVPTLFRVTIRDTAAGTTSELYARKVVLATGIQGGGEWHTPDLIKQSVPAHLYAHTSQVVDLDALRGKRIAILGGGASAFDNAQYALGAGAGEVHVFVRRESLPRVNPIRFMEQAGFLKHFADLPDATKYAGIDHFLGFNQPPTNDTYNRACAYPNFHLHLGANWEALQLTQGGDQVRITTTKGEAEGAFDFLIVSTGLLTDCHLRPELALLAPHIATWADKFPKEANPGVRRNQLIDDHPYLGPAFEFTEKVAGAAPFLRGLYAYNYSALPSLGLSASALSGVKFALPKLVTGITRSLFLEDSPAIISDYLAYNEEEFVGVWPPADRATPAAPSTTAAARPCGEVAEAPAAAAGAARVVA
uniref:indole-3-pyruvate monooxygenase n=1 Tax=Chlamydomonas leiostraca TaxID=1034604 RepID=A0A7S0WQE9_9CHLO|mmetsp:Transcript_23304/g.59576  ORF Transcript_23304/g.59576 Transcript_23304/m.59576 type:complete len:549 (+) Transcript_23304:102-1748(+)|eukprot:CAMPEP_0202861340 /NCGR_PEP_ID=MMETSP1391-20130828/2767_1 /ASSEMBLY_ACC=CAM_ASM_000867 /TAXON_ID=1034604 /ORGANISM="Chlamydomonas leiostraca, Strain SAG 11-49" /LENGTH=548 /DNA_ID=CAMNT_0049540713 /DNA_START=66 /DNA_END=1712 /DNA_ORIENTATION=-